MVDAANVVGSRPDGWWKDRAAATRRLHEALLVADVPGDEIVLVLEGGARGGARPGKDAHVRIVHAPKEGDATILAEAQRAGQRGCTGHRRHRRPCPGRQRRGHRRHRGGPDLAARPARQARARLSLLAPSARTVSLAGMSALKFSGPVLPDGESRDLYVVDGRVTYEPQPGAETAARGWIVPGLVDAHNHLGMEDHGAVDDDEVEGQALADRDAGALLLRDCGSPADTRWVHERDDLPRLVRAGRHVARTRRYIRNYAHEVEPEELSAHVAQEAQRRRRLGQAGGRLDLARRRRPGAVVPAGELRRGHRGGAPPRRQGDRALLRPRRAAGPARRRHRLHRARHRARARAGRADGGRAGSRWCRR